MCNVPTMHALDWKVRVVGPQPTQEKSRQYSTQFGLNESHSKVIRKRKFCVYLTTPKRVNPFCLSWHIFENGCVSLTWHNSFDAGSRIRFTYTFLETKSIHAKVLVFFVLEFVSLLVMIIPFFTVPNPHKQMQLKNFWSDCLAHFNWDGRPQDSK